MPSHQARDHSDWPRDHSFDQNQVRTSRRQVGQNERQRAYTGRTVVDFQQLIDRVIRIVKLQPDAYHEVAEDESATIGAFIVAVAASTLGSIGTSLGNADIGIGSAIVGAIIFAPVGLLIATGVFHLIAKIFGGTGDFMSLLRPLGHGYAPAALGLIPIVGLLGSIWALVCSAIAVREVHGLSTGAAVAVVLIPAAVMILVVVLLIVLLVAALSAA